MDVCYCDTETSGLRAPHLPGGRRTWEIALIRETETGEFIDAAWLQIVDVNLADADPASLNIGRFHERWSDEPGARWTDTRKPVVGEVGDRRVNLRGMPEDTAALIVERLTRGAVLAGSNPGFDELNFADLLHRNGQPTGGWYHHPRDIPNVATGWLLATDQAYTAEPHEWTGPSYSTGKLSEACGIPVPADRHSAWADTLWMRAWDRKMRGIETPA